MKLEFHGLIFERQQDVKFHENHLCGSRILHTDGQTWRR